MIPIEAISMLTLYVLKNKKDERRNRLLYDCETVLQVAKLSDAL